MTQHYALLGWPVAHSVSPQMQNAGFQALGISADYQLLPTPPEQFNEQIQRLIRDDFRGWNLTIPHKQAILPLLDEIDPDAERAGSVNTVRHESGRLRGWSTDGYGLAKSIEETFHIPLADRRFVFWGAGGAARATAAYFAGHGAAAIAIVNRTRSRAEKLAGTLRQISPDPELAVFSPDSTNPELARTLADAHVIIQCTSIGLQPEDPCAIPLPLLDSCPRILDMIYRETALQREAQRRGIPVADGRGMLLHQGVRCLSLWTDCSTPPLAAMRRALSLALQLH